MKKRIFLVCVIALTSMMAFGQMKTKIAIMDFKPGVGVDNSTVNSLSDMLINSMFSTGHYIIVERSQIDHVIREQGFQKNNVPDEAAVKIGKFLGVKALVLGTVNKVNNNGSEEYNIDVRIVDVENAELISTAGVTKTNFDTYRDLMDKLAIQLDTKIHGYHPHNPIDETAGKFIINYRFDYSLMHVGNYSAMEYISNYENRYNESPEKAWMDFTDRIEPSFIGMVNRNSLINEGYFLSNQTESNYEVVISFMEVDKDGEHTVTLMP